MAAPSASSLTPGTIEALYQDDKASPLYHNPVLQIINIKKLNTQGASLPANSPDRYRMILSDGVAYFQGMLSTSLNEHVTTNILVTYAIIHLKKFTLSTVKDRRILIVLDVDTRDITYLDSKIGTPVNIEELMGTRPASATSGGVSTTTAPSDSAAKPNVRPPMSTSNPSAPTTMPIPSSSSRATYSSTSTPMLPVLPSTISYHPISSLSPYQNKWTIKARVTSKSDIKTWTNARGEGRLFSVNLLDETGEIKLTGFNEAVNIFYPLFEMNKIYLISKGSVKLAKKQFSTLANEYEIHLEKDSSVILVPETGSESSHIPSVKYNFVRVNDLVQYQKDDSVDMIGIVKEIGELGSITTKAAQKQLSKREVVVVDMSLFAVRTTLWGKQAEEANPNQPGSDWAGQPVLVIKGARVSDYGGRTLSIPSSSTILLNPDIREAHELRGWFDTVGQRTEFSSTSSFGGLATSDSDGNKGKGSASLDDRKCVAAIKEESLGLGDKPDYFGMIATITFIKGDGPISYAACPGTGEGGSGLCNKKVTEEGPNLYRCEKCQRTYDHCEHRYILSLQISDCTGQYWINAFNEMGEMILGKTAAEMHELKQIDEPSYQRIIKKASFKTFLFRLKAKQEFYQGESKIRCSAMSIQEVQYARESKLLAEALTKATAGTVF